MRRLSALLMFLALAIAAPASAQSDKHPWEAHTRLLETVNTAIRDQGIKGVAPHLQAMKQAMADAPAAYAAANAGDGKARYVLVDGTADMLVASMVMSIAGQDAAAALPVVAIESPYPEIAFVLGFYLVDVGEPEEAVLALESGANLPSLGFVSGQTKPSLLAELGVAQGQLKRYADAVASYEAVLAIDTITDRERARALRGRGIALIDLNRLDEAEADLQKSQQIEPDSPVAKNELAYIARLRAGGQTTTQTLTTSPR